MAARLKVFVTSDGLTDYVVAATSRPKALAAWGAHQDLFATGLAHETDEPALAEAARAKPGEVLRRPAGSRAALAALKPTPKAKAKPGPKAAPAKPKGPSKAALRRVAELEAKLKAAQAAHARALDDLDRQRQALETRHAKERQRLEDALSAARQALA